MHAPLLASIPTFSLSCPSLSLAACACSRACSSLCTAACKAHSAPASSSRCSSSARRSFKLWQHARPHNVNKIVQDSAYKSMKAQDRAHQTVGAGAAPARPGAGRNV
eukprot:1159185-Pelagomonas_calceolata.AAC.2